MLKRIYMKFTSEVGFLITILLVFIYFY